MWLLRRPSSTSGLQSEEKPQLHLAELFGSIWLETQTISFSSITLTFVYYTVNIVIIFLTFVITSHMLKWWPRRDHIDICIDILKPHVNFWTLFFNMFSAKWNWLQNFGLSSWVRRMMKSVNLLDWRISEIFFLHQLQLHHLLLPMCWWSFLRFSLMQQKFGLCRPMHSSWSETFG